MAKVRVYELAKELEMTNKDLIAKILDLGIHVKGHQSSLEEEQAQLVRDTVAGRSEQMIVERRIRPDVIRRRRKIIRKEPPPEEVHAEPQPEEAAAEVAPAAGAEPQEAAAQPAAPAAGLVEAEEAAAEMQAAGPAAVDTPAALAAGEATEQAQVEEEKKPEVEEGAAALSPEEEATPEAAPGAEAEPSAAAAAPEEAAAAAPEAGPGPEPVKIRRRLRREPPAKIIKLPERAVEPPRETKVETTAEPVVPTPIPAPSGVSDKPERPAKAKKKKGKRAAGAEDEVAARRRLPSRRKEVLTGEDLYGARGAKAMRGRRAQKGAAKEVKKPEITVPKAIKRRIKLDEAITVANLAKRMGIKASEIIKKLLELGLMVTVNQAIDYETASLVAAEYDFEVEKAAFEEEEIIHAEPDREEDLRPRPPVVTIMGHVDHGKTSLLDVIRHTNVIEGEAGGITQHIGAYHVKLDGGDVVFLDTPGHEAFTAMRARGAKITDLVVLVVAADDGVMQQTLEAINHARAAGIPILVAINKIDKPNANPDRVRRELAEHGLTPEEWGGDTTMVEVSAKKNIGIDELLELILLQAELMELKANPKKMARGRVIEAKLDKGKGPVATILVQEGTLRTGDAFVCGVHYGRVRAMLDDRGQRVDEAGPAMPVEVHGISGVPQAGDEFIVVADEKQARQVAQHRQLKQREAELSKTSKVTLDNLFARIKEGEAKELNIVLRADVQGSLEAITEALEKLSTDEVKVRIIHSATGAITETDVMLASASDAIVVGFNVRADSRVLEVAEAEKVDLRFYDVIYQIIADVTAALEGMLEPTYKEHLLGRAEVLQTFGVPKVGTVAGCTVHEGKIERGAKVRVLRDNVVVHDSKIDSLRRFKDDVKEVRAGQECGIHIEKFNDVKVGDVLEVYMLEEIKPVLEHSGQKND